MSSKVYTVDYFEGRVRIPPDMKQIFSISNHAAPLPLFADANLMDLAVYIAWKSNIAPYYSVSLQETASFRLWAMGDCLFPGEHCGPRLPRVAIASTTYFPEAKKITEEGTEKSYYELFRWFIDNFSTILPGCTTPEWIHKQGNTSGISVAQEFYWKSLDEDFQFYFPIYKKEAHPRILYLGWLRKNKPHIFSITEKIDQYESSLDVPAIIDTGEGITTLMEAFYYSSPSLHHVMRLDSAEGRLAFSSWFLRHEAQSFGVTTWTWSSLMAFCSSGIDKQALPKGVVGVFLSECPSFEQWEQLDKSAQRRYLATFLTEISPLIQEYSFPKHFLEILSTPTGECHFAEKYGVGLLQQSLWENSNNSLLKSTEDCLACSKWYVQTYADTPLFSLCNYRQIVAWDAHNLFSQQTVSGAIPIFLQEHEPNSVTVLGWQDGMLGIGVDSRIMAEALKSVDIVVYQAAVSHLLPFAGTTLPLESKLRHGPSSVSSIFCLAAQDIYRLWLASPYNWWAGHYNIGLCPWELPRWPKRASFAVEMLDEIWAPSAFAAKAFAECGRPVIHMPHAVIPPEPDGNLRKELGINPETIVFLTAFDTNASCTRKNPFAVMKAFNAAFAGTNHNVRLIVKTMNATNNSVAWQKLHDMNHCGDKVTLIDEAYSKEKHTRLLNTCDAFVSLHRSEGFGRLLAEAMSIGKILICSNYGGNTDFATPETACLIDGSIIPVLEGEYLFSQEQVWYDANVEHAADCMKDIVASPEKYSPMRNAGKQYILERHSCAAIGELALHRLRENNLLSFEE